MWTLSKATDDVLDTLNRVNEEGTYNDILIKKISVIKMENRSDEWVFKIRLDLVNPLISFGLLGVKKFIVFNRRYMKPKKTII